MERNKKGAGSVVRIGNLWYARWRIQGEDVYGDQGHPERDAAELERLTKKPAAAQPKVKKSTIPTLQVWAHQCMLGDYGKRLADSTHDTNESIRLNQVEGSAIGRKRLDKITHADCQAFANGIEGSPSWVRRVCAFVSRMFTLAKKEGLIRGDNPMSGLDLPEVEERDNRILAPEEAEVLLNPVRRVDAIMLVAMHTGMRKSEILRLQWGNVGKDVLKIPQTKGRKGLKPIPLTPEARAAIMMQPKRSSFVFSTESGKPLSPRNVSRDVVARKAQLGIPEETRLHDLRGTFGSLMLEGGTDIKSVQELMRHRDVRTTMKMYMRARTQTKVAAIETLRQKTGAKAVDVRQPDAKQG
jgi:integrase